jgi:hypothetical protein
MSLTYSQYLQELAILCNTSMSNPTFIAEVPRAIDFAEVKICQDLDLLSTYTRDATTTLVGGNPNYTAPSTFVVVTQLLYVTPVATQPDVGTRHPLTPVSLDFINNAWPDRTVQAAPFNVPIYFAPLSEHSFVLAPTPDANYVAEVVGTQRPLPLSPTNPTTSISTYLPSLFNAASMIYMSGFQKNFGSQADNPQQAVSWAGMYKELLTSGGIEEARKKFQGPGWNPYQPTPIATPARG